MALTGVERVLVTGAAGFIGSHLSERLLDEGMEVWGLDNFDAFYDPGIKRRNLEGALSRPDFHFVEGDIRDGVLLGGLLSDVSFDAVVHLAARPGVRPSLDEPAACFDANVMGTITLLEAMQVHHVRRFIFASCGSVYGNRPDASVSEDDQADRPTSPFAASKRTGELLCHTYHHLYGFSVYCLRMSSVYGPRLRPDLAIHKFAEFLDHGEPLPLYDDATGARDYTYVDDIVEGIVRAIDRLASVDGGAKFDIVNLSNGIPVRLTDLVEAMSKAFGMTPKVERLEEQHGDVPVTSVATDRLRDVLGFEPSTSLDEGLRRFAEWFRIQRPIESTVPEVEKRVS
ncbi:MAG: NAD-dependent epimerase/dehydratase family protein [Gemmatimonadota bacterium]